MGSERHPALEEIETAYEQGKLVLFVGAGLSIAAGLPSPRGLAELVAAHATKDDVERKKAAEIAEIQGLLGENKLIEAISASKRCLGSPEFYAFIERKLDDGHFDALPPLAHAVAALRPKLRAVVTTNLDRLLERAFQGIWLDLARATADVARRERFILKLHGTLADRATWVLTRDDYDRALHLDVNLQEALRTLFNGYPLLFVGYDFEGDDFAEILGRVRAFAGKQPPRHFALVPSGTMGPYQQRRLEDAGVKLVPYVEPAGDQRELVKILNRLAGNDEPPPSSVAAREVSSVCPFPGLEFFDRDRAEMFFGRESEISEAAQRLGQIPAGRHVRWLQIEGPSGAGKSSLARAGLVPAVEKKEWIEGVPRKWRVAIFRPGVDPVMSLAHAVRSAFAEEMSEGETLGVIVDGFRKRPGDFAAFLREHMTPGEGFLLVVDQLEEAFTFGEVEARRAFDALLASAVRDKGGPLYMISTIRSDFVGKMSALPELEGLLNAEAERYHLKTMSSPGMRAAMVEPAKLAGLRWEPDLPERLLRDAAGSEGGLPLLAHALQALWVAREGDMLTHAAYGELGEIGGALSRSADAILESLGEEGKARAKRLLLRLVKIGRGAEDTRRTATREEAIEAAGQDAQAERVLGRLSGERDRDTPEGALAEARLLVVGDGDVEGGRVDLVHEALLRRWDTLKGWIAEGRKALQRRDDLEAAAQVWGASGSSVDGLPGGSQLAYLRGAEAAGKQAQKFLEAAIAKEKKSRRRGRLIIVALSAGVMAFGGLAAFAGVQRTTAQQRLTDAIEVADQVLFVVDRKLELVAGAADVRKELLEQSAKLLDHLIADAGDSKEALRSRMDAHIQRGNLALTHDNLVLARREYEAGLVIADGLIALNPHSAIFQRDLSFSYGYLGDVAKAGGDLSTARRFFEKGLELSKTLAAADPHNVDFQRDLSVFYVKLGTVAQALGDLSTARTFFNNTVELFKALAEAAPHNAGLQRDLSASYENLGDVANAAGDLGAARTSFDKAHELIKALAAADPNNANLQRDLSVTYDRLGTVVEAGGDLGAARDFFEKGLDLSKALAAADPRNALLQRDLSVAYVQLGDVARAGKDLDAARGFFDQALEIRKVLAAGDPHNAALQRDLAVNYEKLGVVAQAGGKFRAARGFFDNEIELFNTLVAKDPHDANAQRSLAIGYEKLGEVEQARDHLSAAGGYFNKDLELTKALAEADPHNAALQIGVATGHVKLIGLALQMNALDVSTAHQLAATAILDQLDRDGLGTGNVKVARLRAFLASLHE